MKLLLSSVALAVLLSTTAGCVTDTTAEDLESEGEVGVAPSPQVDGGSKVYWIEQSSVAVASAWVGPVGSGGTEVEYWVSKPGYSATTTRTFTGSSESCANWKAAVCGTGWSSATYYQAVFVEETLDCGYPPDPCTPPTNATTFLGSGSYMTRDSLNASFAWTYVDSDCEYWAMDHTISTGTNTQLRLRPADSYSSYTDFLTEVCSMSPVPSTFYSVYYVPVANFCSTSTC